MLPLIGTTIQLPMQKQLRQLYVYSPLATQERERTYTSLRVHEMSKILELRFIC